MVGGFHGYRMMARDKRPSSIHIASDIRIVFPGLSFGSLCEGDGDVVLKSVESVLARTRLCFYCALASVEAHHSLWLAFINRPLW